MDDDLTTVYIDREAVYFNGHKLPGAIAKNGVTFKPGGKDGINRLIVEFFVGHVEVPDPTLYQEVIGD